MQKHGSLKRNVNPLRIFSRHSGNHSGSRSPRVVTEQQSSPTVLPEKCGSVRSIRASEGNVLNEDLDKIKVHEHRIDIGDEHSDLLGYVVVSGKLFLDKKTRNTNADVQISKESIEQNGFDAKLTSKALIWGTHTLYINDIISVSYNSGLRHFTVHSCPIQRKPCGLSCFIKPKRCRKDFRFLASTSEEAIKWVSGFADQQCYVNCLPHPVSSQRQGSDVVSSDFFAEPYIMRKKPPTLLVILNPRSGRGRSSKVFYSKVEPIFKLAGFNMEVVKTTSPGHARTLASTVDFNTCPDGIICVGGDGIVNEVLNGLLCRKDQKEAISIPIGIIPAGSDNSLVWTVLGVRDPVSAAITIVKGGLTATDVFAVEWIQSGGIHFGITVSYYGFVSDVLELSDKYQKRFGPLRYLVAGVLKFLCLPRYSFEVEYLPVSKAISDVEGTLAAHGDPQDSSILYPDIMRKSTIAGITRASSLSSIDSILTPSRMSGELDTTSSTIAGSEPSDFVRGIDPKAKRMSFGRSNATHEPEEVLHPPALSATPSRPRTRSKSRTEKGWTLTTTNDSRGSWAHAAGNDKEDISSTLSDPGPIWDAEPKWDTDLNCFPEDPLQFLGLGGDTEACKHEIPKQEEKWIGQKGEFLGVLLCNHACKTVQNLNSQVLAPKAEHDDRALDLLLVHGNGRLKLLRFFLLMQFGKHLSLPYVEYVQVKSLRLKPGKNAHNGCGVDGELLSMKGQVVVSLLPEQCRLIGRPAQDRV
ncbi:sphingoid long-chain bases kinase 1-like [Nymphaea colorata]|nr:sphingoid long-chain bases kinase 1-like [Nymphaea colorata]XP_031494521.1 sphingoid long-chain bases kinase 1-like [Nymphaea colorata]